MAGRPKRGSVTKAFVPPSSIIKASVPVPPVVKAAEAVIKSNLPANTVEKAKVENEQNGAVVANAAMETSDEVSLNDGDMEKKSLFRKFFGGVRKKTTARERKMRQNRRLRRILIPKNALMALHEIKGIKMSDFVINSRMGGGFTAEVTVNNIQYEGYGPSKLSAKNSVCEKALRDLIISKMLQSPSRQNSTEQIDAMGVTVGEDKAEQGNNFEGDGEDVQMKELDEDESDVPMINLASFALYKLFSEWENEGFEVPEFRNHASSNNNNSQQQGEKPKKPPTIRNELPPNWEEMHPTTLLCMMRPGIAYTDLGWEGNPTTPTQKMGVSVDGEHFIGLARSKKLARRDAACLACNKIFGTNFEKEVSTLENL